MPSVATVLATYSSAVATLTGGTRMASDLRRDLESISAGSTKFQLIGIKGGVDAIDSNTYRAAMAVRLDVHHRLSGSESTYTANAMSTALEALLTPSWWIANGVFQVLEVPNIALSDVVRTGNVVSYTVTLVVSVNP